MSIHDTNLDKYRFRITLLHPRNWTTWVGLLVFFLLTLLPMFITDKLGCYLGCVALKRNNKRLNIVKTNLLLCFPKKEISEIDSMVGEHFQAQYRSLVHYYLLWWRPVNVVRKRMALSGFEKITYHQSQGKNVIIMLPHTVGLEFAIAALSMVYASVGLYKPMKNPVIDWVVANGRIKFGKTNGAKLFTREDGLRPLIRETRAGKVLVYLADEDLGRKNSIFAPFYGVQKATIPVIGRLAKACDAVVLPCVTCYDASSKSYRIGLLDEIKSMPAGDDEKDSLAMNQSIEQVINYCPAQYLWTLRYFKTRPQGEASVYD
jgi:lauroyl-KDO2-lipid IV(A) myristoyltransferase